VKEHSPKNARYFVGETVQPRQLWRCKGSLGFLERRIVLWEKHVMRFLADVWVVRVYNGENGRGRRVAMANTKHSSSSRECHQPQLRQESGDITHRLVFSM